MNGLNKAGKLILIVLVMGMFFVSQANGQTGTSTTTPAAKEGATEEGWHASIAPYVWFSGVHGTVGALGHEAGVDATFGDLFNYLNIGVMGTVEVRYSRVIMPVDFLWMSLSDNKALPINDAEAESIHSNMKEFIVTPKIGYRIADGRRVKIDALFGARIWHLNTSLNLQPRELNLGFAQATTWADAVAGGRFTFMLTPKVAVIVAGDAGGISSRSDWQLVGLLGYKLSRGWSLLAGYRYLSVDYRPGTNKQFVYDVNMPGAVLGAEYTFK